VEPPTSISANFDAVGFGTTLFLNNLGTIFFLLLLFPLLMLIAKLMKCFKKYQFIRLQIKKIERFVYWSGTLRIFLESYTILAICAFINFTDLTWNGFGYTFMSVCAISAMAFCMIFPFAVIGALYKNYDKIKEGDEEFEETYGALWEGIKIN